jgi:hypothetical protein
MYSTSSLLFGVRKFGLAVAEVMVTSSAAAEDLFPSTANLSFKHSGLRWKSFPSTCCCCFPLLQKGQKFTMMKTYIRVKH